MNVCDIWIKSRNIILIKQMPIMRFFSVIDTRRRPQSTVFKDAIVHKRGDTPYGSREYILLPPNISLEEMESYEKDIRRIRDQRSISTATIATSKTETSLLITNKNLLVVDDESSFHSPAIISDHDDPRSTTTLKIASIRAHRNILFAATLHEPSQSYSLMEVCPLLVEMALVDASGQGEQPQAISTLHGLCDWVKACLNNNDQKKENKPTSQTLMTLDPISLEAVQSIATGIPRPGHIEIGTGTYRDGAKAWESVAREYVTLDKSDECSLYKSFGAELISIELEADKHPDYLKSAGGAMARFFFL